MTESGINRIAEYLPDDLKAGRERGSCEESPGVADRFRTWVGERPVVCISVAACLGVALGWLLKRR